MTCAAAQRDGCLIRPDVCCAIRRARRRPKRDEVGPILALPKNNFTLQVARARLSALPRLHALLCETGRKFPSFFENGALT
jgi:hypothetical protein